MKTITFTDGGAIVQKHWGPFFKLSCNLGKKYSSEHYMFALWIPFTGKTWTLQTHLVKVITNPVKLQDRLGVPDPPDLPTGDNLQPDTVPTGEEITRAYFDGHFEGLWRKHSKPAEYCGTGVGVVDKAEARKLYDEARGAIL